MQRLPLSKAERMRESGGISLFGAPELILASGSASNRRFLEFIVMYSVVGTLSFALTGLFAYPIITEDAFHVAHPGVIFVFVSTPLYSILSMTFLPLSMLVAIRKSWVRAIRIGQVDGYVVLRLFLPGNALPRHTLMALVSGALWAPYALGAFFLAQPLNRHAFVLFQVLYSLCVHLTILPLALVVLCFEQNFEYIHGFAQRQPLTFWDSLHLCIYM